MVKYTEKNLDITKPSYNEQILPVPWHIVISRSPVAITEISSPKR